MKPNNIALITSLICAAICGSFGGLYISDLKIKAEVLQSRAFEDGYRCAKTDKTLWQCQMNRR